MNLKIECSCGARFSFDVEPVDGRMPAAVHCPVCQADRTEAANQLIAQNLAGSAAAAVPRLRVQMAASPAPAAEPEVPESVAEYCGRHPASVAVEHCVVRGKPVCMDCMKAFGFLCSIACRNEAKRQKIKVPVFHGQRGVAEQAALAPERLADRRYRGVAARRWLRGVGTPFTPTSRTSPPGWI